MQNSNRARPVRQFVAFVGVALAISPWACSPSTGGSGEQNGLFATGTGGQGTGASGSGANNGTGASGGDTGSGSTGSASGLNFGGGLNTGSSSNADSGCPELPFSAEQQVKTVTTTVTAPQPIDLYIMFDQSLSMTCAIPAGGDRWDAVKTALEGFVQAPGSSGISVGINYFGNSGILSSCTASDYETPNVEIAPLPQNATPLVNSLNGHTPSTNTPTAAALSGAINHALVWKTSHPDDAVAVVLVTDGEPNACGAVSDVANVAKVGWGNGAGVRTFVMGVTSPGNTCGLDPNPPNQADLDSVASAGGTDHALIVDTTKDTSKQLNDELNQARQTITKTTTHSVVQTTKIECQYKLPTLPANVSFDPNRVNITFTNRSSVTEQVFQVPTLSDCAKATTDAWYYDNPTTPTEILVCPGTCAKIQGPAGDAGTFLIDAGVAPLVNVLLGCQTLVAPVH